MSQETAFAGGTPAAVIAALMLCCSISCDLPPQTVDYVDLERYAGLWYEIARYPTPFDEDAVAVTAEYTRNQDGTIGVLNKGRAGTLDGPETSIQGVARVVDPATNAKLAVSFDRPELEGIEFPYWIILLDAQYTYAAVSGPTREVLYILSRSPAMDKTLYIELVDTLVAQGFERGRIELTPQPAD